MEKKEFWAPESLRRYLDACAFLDYPRVPLAKYVEGIIRTEDTVLDLGCGPGASSEYLATLCRQVWAVDTSQAGLDSLRERIAKKGTRNITPLDQPFPQGELPVCDVVVALYVFFLLENRSAAKRLLELTGREGIILLRREDRGFMEEIPPLLGLPARSTPCSRGCHIMGLLEGVGARVECEHFQRDFGQPVADVREAADFIRAQLRAGEEYAQAIEELAPRYLVERQGRLYLPYPRTECVLHYWKDR